MVLTSYNQKTTLHLSGYYFHQVILIFKVTVTVRFKVTVFVRFNYKRNVFDLPFINVTIPPFKLRAEYAATR